MKEKKLQRGETICRYSNGVKVIKWRDKRDVSYISTQHINNIVTTTSKKGQEIQKRKPIADYNKNISEIDFQDQMSYFSRTRNYDFILYIQYFSTKIFYIKEKYHRKCLGTFLN